MISPAEIHAIAAAQCWAVPDATGLERDIRANMEQP
jgi:hypothetical protein